MIWLVAYLWLVGGYGFFALDRLLRERAGNPQPTWSAALWALGWPALMLMVPIAMWLWREEAVTGASEPAAGDISQKT